jgi:hypothetical protein
MAGGSPIAVETKESQPLGEKAMKQQRPADWFCAELPMPPRVVFRRPSA